MGNRGIRRIKVSEKLSTFPLPTFIDMEMILIVPNRLWRKNKKKQKGIEIKLKGWNNQPPILCRSPFLFNTVLLPAIKWEAGCSGNSAANRTDVSCEEPGEHMALIRGQGRERLQWKLHRKREGLYVCASVCFCVTTAGEGLTQEGVTVFSGWMSVWMLVCVVCVRACVRALVNKDKRRKRWLKRRETVELEQNEMSASICECVCVCVSITTERVFRHNKTEPCQYKSWRAVPT